MAWEDDPPPPKPASTSGTSTKKAVEEWAKEKNTPAWLFASAAALHGWPIGRELDESEFTAALDAAANVKLGG
jgi:hypothetical protein